MRTLLTTAVLLLALVPAAGAQVVLGPGAVVVADANGVPETIHVTVGGRDRAYPLRGTLAGMIRSSWTGRSYLVWIVATPEGTRQLVTEAGASAFRAGSTVGIYAPGSGLGGTYRVTRDQAGTLWLN